ncbi:MAG: hypothetical protein AAF789_08895 [Bacteroidota bacterium]
MSRRKMTPLSIQKERVWTHIYGNVPFHDKKMRSLMNVCFSTLKEFVGKTSALSDEFWQQYSLIRTLVKKNQLDMAQKESISLREYVQDETIQSAAYFHHRFQVEVLQFELAGTQERTASNNLAQIFDHSANYFMIQTLRYACIALSHTSVSTKTYEVPLLQSVLNHVEEQNSTIPPTIRLFYFTYLALAHQDIEAFSNMKQSLYGHRQRLPKEQLEELWIMAINFCIKRLNLGDRKFAREAYELYKEGFRDQILLKNGHISRFNFKNVVSIGLILKEFEWVESFIQTYSNALSPDYRESYHNFNLARLRFAQGNYSQAKRMLTVLEYDDVFFNLSSRMMRVKMHYEEKDWDSLDAILLNFSRYLQRKSVIGYHKQVYQNIIGIIQQLLALPPNDTEAKELLIRRIQETQPLAERDWLLQQV